MRPRTGYRVVVIGGPILLLLCATALIEGSWLLAIVAALGCVNMLVQWRTLRARGVDWHGPATFRELRERERAD
jgi:hypothetical protein